MTPNGKPGDQVGPTVPAVIPLTTKWIASAMRGAWTGDAEREFSGVSIDTRTLTPGELFIAIHGEKFDGADFAAAAIAAGAGGAVVGRGRGGDLAREKGARPRFVISEGAETTGALQALAERGR